MMYTYQGIEKNWQKRKEETRNTQAKTKASRRGIGGGGRTGEGYQVQGEVQEPPEEALEDGPDRRGPVRGGGGGTQRCTTNGKCLKS